MWTSPQWRGTVYSAKAPKEKWLRQYSLNFNTVEGNSTFYGIPKSETFQRWAAETADGFRFCLKFPRSISHDQMLVDCDRDLDLFLAGLLTLHEQDRLGPTILQMGPAFGPGHFGALVSFLECLPKEFAYAVEVRHLDFFKPEVEQELNQMLRENGVDRIIFDSRPLFSQPPSDEFEVKSQSRKPRSPVRPFCTGDSPMLRFVGRNDVVEADPWIEEWMPIVAHWIEQGKNPYIFTHSPDDAFAPALAIRFHNALCKYTDRMPPFSNWRQHGAQQQTLW